MIAAIGAWFLVLVSHKKWYLKEKYVYLYHVSNLYFSYEQFYETRSGNHFTRQ